LLADDKNLVGVEKGSRALLTKERFPCFLSRLLTSQTFEWFLPPQFFPPPLNYSQLLIFVNVLYYMMSTSITI